MEILVSSGLHIDSFSNPTIHESTNSKAEHSGLISNEKKTGGTRRFDRDCESASLLVQVLDIRGLTFKKAHTSQANGVYLYRIGTANVVCACEALK